MAASLNGKTILITGASRGIGLEIALRAAHDGANIVVAAKTAEPNPKLEGTIHSAAEEIRKAGGQALPLVLDVRDDDAIAATVAEAAETFGGIDVLINNASAINLSKTPDLPMKRFDLMHQINVRGTFAMTQACYPHLARAENPHVLVLSPPLNMVPQWFGDHCGYTMSKFGMSMCVLGMAEEFRGAGIGINALWPATLIYTAAMNLVGADPSTCRSPRIVADAAYEILTRDAADCTGNFFLDEEVLGAAGISDFSDYAMTPGAALQKDLFVL
ncbi:SDR family oxidoreductase [Salipiger abyssi]|uniref:Citronellol/citronellal dehydrogenase n=1 Tax=Salipiger abyssi TaxID=1250539 RepID=A0A1P8UN63_9RHOB|nr:NAD(P)-dependent oxidoreductase [Salipiger abyssi]APZ50849.1 citronellol/citronellal dehydrogenase [Salipiger abyssi]